MIQTLMLFFAAPDSPQATALKPPAVPVALRRAQRGVGRRLRFAIGVVANALGFGALIGACWFALQVMQALLVA